MVGARRVFRLALIANLLISAVLALTLLAAGEIILLRWLGGEFAKQAHALFPLLIIAFAVLSINVVPHYTLLALGKVRFVSLVNLAGGVISLACAAALIPFIGVNGAALGRLLYGPAVTCNYLEVRRSL
jgi:O-antigen/teichoic acid export membrane protein